jgi:Cd2+/Zn2+-exporting ATPase
LTDAHRDDILRDMSSTHHPHEHEEPGEWRMLAALALACALLGLGALAVDLAAGPAGLRWTLAGLACVAGAWEAAAEGWHALRWHRRIDVHLLMLLAAAGAWVVGQPLEGVLLLFLFSTAGALEHYAMDRTRGAIDALLDRSPKQARRIGPDGTESEVAVASLAPGDRIAILPGELVPADGEVLEGESAVDESNLTGEAKPVSKRPGEAVAGGTLNDWGRLVVQVTRAETDSALHRIVKLIREAQESKAPAQRAIDRWGDAYAIFTLSASVLFFGALLLTGHPFRDGINPANSALYRAMTLLVVLSPCALVLSVPSAVLAAIAAGARHGILFRGGAAVERLADVDCVCFDKTGTLTAGTPVVAALEVLPADADRRRALSALLSLEAGTTHPFAAGVVAACRREGAGQLEVVGLSNSPGQGVSGSVNGTRWSVGTREFTGAREIAGALVPAGAIVSEVWASDGTVTVRATLVDEIRAASAPTLAALHARHIRTVMLTGDREEAAAVAARQVGVQSYGAALTPDAKMAAIRRLSAEGRIVAMVGDGVNDAPGLAAADVAIGMGGRGSDAALESSDVVLTDDRIERLVDAIELSRAARRAIRANVLISVSAALGMAAYVILGPGVPLSVGVGVHEGSTVIVCLNGLRLLAHRPSREN